MHLLMALVQLVSHATHMQGSNIKWGLPAPDPAAPGTQRIAGGQQTPGCHQWGPRPSACPAVHSSCFTTTPKLLYANLFQTLALACNVIKPRIQEPTCNLDYTYRLQLR